MVRQLASSDYNAQFTGINVAIAYLLLVVLFEQGLFRLGESTRGSSPERRIGMPYTLGFLLTEADLVSLAEGNGELENTKEFKEPVREERSVVSLSNTRHS